jgi:predicted phage-related endonuclease
MLAAQDIQTVDFRQHQVDGFSDSCYPRFAMPVQTRKITTRDEWLEWRKPFVGASETPALFNVHPYLSALKLYLAKSGVEFDTAENKVMRRGRLMEPAVGLAVADERPQWTIEKAREFFCDEGLGLACTPDFWITGDPRGRGVLQAKTVEPGTWVRQWEEGARVPFWIVLQCLTECLLTDSAFGAIAALKVDAFDLAVTVHEIERNVGAEKRILDAVKQFWRDVETGNEPGPDYGRDAELLRYVAPRETPGKQIDLSGDNELPVLLEQRAEISDSIKRLEARCDEIETGLKFKMRDAEVVTGLDGWSITWKSYHREEHTVKAKDIRTLRINRRKGL